jgi:small conductance mechanosensitive channel
MGSVKEIQIFNTILTTPDNKTIIIPNGGLSTSSMTNFSTQITRRVDFVFGIAYNANLKQAKQIISDIVNADERVLKDPVPFVRMSEMADSSVNITTRIWVKPENYWDVYFDTMEAVYEAFNSNGINIPFPQMDVHVHNTNA